MGRYFCGEIKECRSQPARFYYVTRISLLGTRHTWQVQRRLCHTRVTAGAWNSTYDEVPVARAFVLIYQSCVYLSNQFELPTNTDYASRNETINTFRSSNWFLHCWLRVADDLNWHLLWCCDFPANVIQAVRCVVSIAASNSRRS